MSKQWEHKEGSFFLFNNDRKTNDTQPDMRGDGMFKGVICAVSAWRKTGARGEFLSLRLEEKREVAPGSLPYAGREESSRVKPGRNTAAPVKSELHRNLDEDFDPPF